MKKRILATLVCAAMGLSLLAGCGGQKADTASKSESKSTSEAKKRFQIHIDKKGRLL